MSLLYGRCAWLRSCLVELMDQRRQVVLVVNGPPLDLPTGWETWVPWLSDTPNAYISSIVSNCDHLRNAIHAFTGLRKELGDISASSIEQNFRVFLESWLRQPWLEKIEQGNCYCGEVGEDGDPAVEQEWVLSTCPPPVAKAETLMLIAKEIVLERERKAAMWDEGWRSAELPDLSPPKQVGRPKLINDPRWIPAIPRLLAMGDAGMDWPEITSALESEFPALGP